MNRDDVIRFSHVLATAALLLVVGCAREAGDDPFDDDLTRDEAMRADQEMRDSADALIRERDGAQ